MPDDISITGGPTDQHVTISSGGHQLADADVDSTDGPEVVRATMGATSKPLAASVGAQLVDAVLELPAVAGADRLEASIPTADAGLVQRVRERTEGLESRLAGSTVLVVTHPRPASPATEQGSEQGSGPASGELA